MLDESRKKIATAFDENGSTNYKILIEIKGSFLIENNLVNEWAEQRQKDPSIITEDWSDYITLYQAMLLGVLDFVKKN